MTAGFAIVLVRLFRLHSNEFDSRLCLRLDVENQLETSIDHAPTVGQDLQQRKLLTKKVALLVCKDWAQQETCMVLRVGRDASTHHLQCTVADVCLDERWCREVGKEKASLDVTPPFT